MMNEKKYAVLCLVLLAWLVFSCLYRKKAGEYMWLGRLVFWKKTYKVVITPKGNKSKSYTFILKAKNLRELSKKLKKQVGRLENYDIDVFERVS